MTRFLRFITWVRLTDDDGLFSLTHLAVYLAFYCMVRGVPVSWTEMGAFLIAMSSYRVKRALEDGKDTNAVGDRVQVLEDKVGRMQAPDRAMQAQAMLGRPSGR
jgi:hypothetical protein